ncbi:MAG: anaerobic ribonucleoside-triphosphate reductase activating protein, partial [Firmicutes bacterium HGW-Firmicutes-13]
LLDRITPVHNGVTFSGGEPLAQPEALLKVISHIKEKRPDIDIWVYTGFSFEEVINLPVLNLIDILVDGPFVMEKRDLSLAFRGSSNQRIINVPESLKRREVVEL